MPVLLQKCHWTFHYIHYTMQLVVHCMHSYRKHTILPEKDKKAKRSTKVIITTIVAILLLPAFRFHPTRKEEDTIYHGISRISPGEQTSTTLPLQISISHKSCPAGPPVAEAWEDMPNPHAIHGTLLLPFPKRGIVVVSLDTWQNPKIFDTY